MKTKHTPGPWMVYVPERGQDGHPHSLSIIAETETRATYVAGVPGSAHYDWAQANARLIAAAPDLLAVVERYLNESPDVPAGIDTEADTIHAQMWRAVAKAKAPR